MKLHDQKQFGKERVYFVYTSTPQLITEENWDRIQTTGIWRQVLRSVLTGLLSLLCYHTQDLELRQVALLLVGWAVPRQSRRICPTSTYSLLLRQFLSWSSPLSDDSSFSQGDKTTANQLAGIPHKPCVRLCLGSEQPVRSTDFLVFLSLVIYSVVCNSKKIGWN